jgi:hypothetical protein
MRGNLSKGCTLTPFSEFVKDFATKNTKNWSAMMNSEGEARAIARKKIGTDPIEVEPNKWRTTENGSIERSLAMSQEITFISKS